MSRRLCVLLQGFSEANAANCSKHRHVDADEADEKIAAGEIEPLDVHPIRKTQRYIVRIHGRQRNHIPAGVIERAAGIYRANVGEIRWAKTKIESYAYRTVVLPRIVWKRDGLEGNFESDGRAPKGNPVSVTLKPRTPETVDAAAAVWSFMTIRPATMRALVRSRMREWLESLQRLDSMWREIVVDFSAGPFSEQMMEALPSNLPSTIVHRVLQAFLQQ